MYRPGRGGALLFDPAPAEELIGSSGDVDAAKVALGRDPNISDADWHTAFEVFKHHKSYEGGA